jgi:DNA-binding NarL/FixJ family response regulator
MQIASVMIVDDDPRIRQRVRKLLATAPDIEVIAEAIDGREATLKARALRPDLIVMDVRMPVLNGLDATRQIRAEMPELKVIMLTIFDLQEYRDSAIACGVSGYVIKTSLLQDLLPAIRQSLDVPSLQRKA